MGSWDWNDGMNRVGKQGRGESVWLAFFLYDVPEAVRRTGPRVEMTAFADQCLAEARKFQGERRGARLGRPMVCRATLITASPWARHTNPECQIDSLPQAGRSSAEPAIPSGPAKR